MYFHRLWADSIVDRLYCIITTPIQNRGQRYINALGFLPFKGNVGRVTTEYTIDGCYDVALCTALNQNCTDDQCGILPLTLNISIQRIVRSSFNFPYVYTATLVKLQFHFRRHHSQCVNVIDDCLVFSCRMSVLSILICLEYFKIFMGI